MKIYKKNIYNNIIIGGGNAGVEASFILSNLNLKTLLITSNIDNLGLLSCNPSIGGIGKGNLVKEIDYLGGIMGKASDKSGLQFKYINFSKGDAVKSIRIQVDRNNYKNYIQNKIKKKKNLNLSQEVVEKLIIKKNKIIGILTNINNIYISKNIILTTGTFLNGCIYIGKKKFKSGRINENPSNKLAQQLKKLMPFAGRLKTGTSPRIGGLKINFKKLKKQKSDINPIPFFSKWNKKIKKKTTPCWISYTNKNVNNIIINNIKKSPIYKNILNGVGPRYCPSIEDKIYRFYKKNKHQIFLEPENNKCNEFYISGLSTSMPYKIQKNLIKSINGIENTYIIKPGYMVEYDFFNPKYLKKSLEHKLINGLFLAGQINGTTGYEEAAAQGVVAGINCYLKKIKSKPWYPNKNNSYIGILINDIVDNGINEPYRIFTNKSENNIILRKDNILIRLFNLIKLLFFLKKNLNYFFLKKKLIKTILFIKKKKNIIFNIINENNFLIKNIKNKIFNYFKYKGYFNQKNKKFFKKNFFNKLIFNFNFLKIKGLSNESCEKLNKKKPKNIKEIINFDKINLNEKYIILKFFKKYI